jgi:hypothetical protein
VQFSVKHAGPDTFSRLTEFLGELRQRPLLREKSTGIFYIKATAFLHFHDDTSGIFADVKLDQTGYSRCRVSTRSEQKALLKKIDRCLAAQAATA